MAADSATPRRPACVWPRPRGRELLGLRPALPVPAGGMALARVPEILDFYGPDTMLLIGGSLLAARERLTVETAAFTHRVAAHRYR